MTGAAAQLEQDARMTAQRSEAKYLVSAAQAKTLVREIDRRLSPHRHVGEGANKLPDPQHHVTTIYFDTTSRTLFQAAQSNENHLKLRAKEYYDIHPGLTETATDPRQLVRYSPTLWLELKSRDGVYSGKKRIGLPKKDVPAFFARGEITVEMISIQEASYGTDARRVLEAVAALCASCGESLHADCLVNYRRMAWQDDKGEVRITLDRDLAFYKPPADLWTRDWALLRSTLGPAVAKESRRVLEVKLQGEPPAWLADLLKMLSLEITPFSKFEAASSAVHG
jgi:hypothetical protein